MTHAALNGVTSASFRFRDDDGGEGESAATWLGAMDANIQLPADYGIFRLRIGVEHYSIIAAQQHNFNLKVSVDEAPYYYVQADGQGGESDVKGQASSYITNHDDTFLHSTPLAGGTAVGTPNYGHCTDDEVVQTGTVTWGQSVDEGHAIEFCLELIEADLDSVSTLDFQFMANYAVPSGGYEQIPRITIPRFRPYPYQRRAYSHNLRR